MRSNREFKKKIAHPLQLYITLTVWCMTSLKVCATRSPSEGTRFGELTSKRVRWGSFCRSKSLYHAITEFLAEWNENLRPFV